MSEFVHSEILFLNDDGIPLEFNIQYVKDKASIKSVIEHGGGLCTSKDDVIHIVSPGTTVINVTSGIKLVSTSYIYDCLKQNYLLDIDEYRFVINEMETSDISDNSQSLTGDQGEQKCEDNIVNNAVGTTDRIITTPSPNTQSCPTSNHDFDFQESENPDNLINNEKDNPATSLQHVGISSKPETNEIEKDCNEAAMSTDSLKSFPISVDNGEIKTLEVSRISENNQILNDKNQDTVEPNNQDTSINDEIVSSSQPEEDVSDPFDNMVLRKAQENSCEKDDDSLSQSYTVSSSADAQVSPKVLSNTSAEIFDGSHSVPDSASQSTERQQYINDLEKEVEQILQKPSPKSIQDKIAFVKYICTVKKLAPAIVLQTLQNF